VDLLRYAHFTLGAVLALAAWGFWRLHRTRTGIPKALWAAWILLFLLSWRPFSTLMVGSLEWQSTALTAQPAGEQAIVVLSAGIYMPKPQRPLVIADLHTYVRCRHAAWLYQNGWKLPVVATGGSIAGGRTLAEAMIEVLRKEGVAPADLLQEGNSVSTYENARLTAALLRPRGIRSILLVTEAVHMPRAIGAFRKAGFEVTPAPCFFQSAMFEGNWSDWLVPTPRSLVLCEDVIHEWIGLALYRLAGRS